MKQHTIKNSIRATGVGLHTGKQIHLTLHPAPVDTGIVFRRIDQTPVLDIKADVTHVGATQLSTTLLERHIRIGTIEHLLAALAGLRIDNLYVEVDAEEIPIMDGSAAPFVFLLESAGIKEQSADRTFIRIKQPVMVQDGDRWARLEPFSGLRMTLVIDFEHPIFQQHQEATFQISTTTFIKEISRARTFGFMRDIERLWEQNLALGGTLENAVVVGDRHVLNEEGLRYKDEFVRHKILDALGDLYLLGHPLLATFSGYKSGHTLNNRLLHQVLATPAAWECVTLTDEPTRTPVATTDFVYQPA